MEKQRRIEAGDFLLPEVLIQRVQSFMNGKQAVRTSILSKSWYNAWSTRPNLDFDQLHFGNPDNWEFAKKSIQRYEALKLNIDSFRLCVLYLKRPVFRVAEELIVKAIKMGALDFEFDNGYFHEDFSLPREVLGSEKLIRLYVKGCKIDVTDTKVCCCRKLKSLFLGNIGVEGDIIRDFISKCPLIEKLTLVWIRDQHYTRCLLGSFNLYKLRSLVLRFVNVDTLFYSNLSSNFPCLKELTLEACYSHINGVIQLSSRSLECISFMKWHLLRANFDIPSIRKFEFSGWSLPALFFKTTSSEWESDIRIRCHSPSTAWFLELKELLTCLSSSKISLTLHISGCIEKSVDFRGLPETPVENLTIHSFLFRDLDCFLWSFRPKFITLHDLYLGSVRKRKEVKKDFVEIVSQKNVVGVRAYCLMMNHDLDEVDVEFFEKIWSQPRKIRFQLRWRD